MGTRHLTIAAIDGAYKLAQYGQWDGYPEGQGVVVLDFLQHMDRERFTAALRKCWFIDGKEKTEILQGFGMDADGTIRMDDYRRFSKAHPQWSRDTGAGILNLIDRFGGLALENDLDFAGDSLFCEYAYVIDFDANTFEVYEGFNHDPLPDGARFASLQGKTYSDEKYYPIKLRKSWLLNELPSRDDFLEALRPEDYTEE